MNSKAQMGLAAILLVFIAVIVGVILFQAIAQNVGGLTNTVAVANESLGANAANGTAQYLTNYRAISSVVVYNETGDALVPATNYTVTDNVVYNGNLAWRIVPNTTADLKYKWQISGTAQPLTYIPDSGGRAIAGMIVIFFALAVGVIALYPVYKGELASMLQR